MASVGIRLSSKSQGKGYGTEALAATVEFCFTKTELKRLWAEVDIRNVASVRILEKCGFTREGMIRQGKMVNTWCDYYIYGILDSDI
ncbi:GNAT family N-acetyltransferase [Gracilibacillus sp. Marseille-QA3620]